MIRETYEKIVKGIEVRQNVSLLRQELKEEGGSLALTYFLGGDFSVIEKLLSHEDAKTRKNTALLLGDIGDKRLLEPLYQAYEREDTLFVRSAYLKAMKEFDCRKYLPALKRRMEELSCISLEMDKKEGDFVQEELPHKKHIREELRELSELLVIMEGIQPHTFIGEGMTSDLVLLTNRDHVSLIGEQVKSLINGPVKEFSAGIMATTDQLAELSQIRTIEEIFFGVRGMKNCPMEPEKAARKIIDAGFLSFLKERHEEGAPFYFRIECKSGMSLDKKSSFTKKMAEKLEQYSGRALLNSTSRYEVELRLIENKEGRFNVLVKLFTFPDKRFDYRKEVIPTSIRPVNAALTAALAKDYLKPDGKVLDPFCGTGTMLIERHKLVKANTMYGIDLFGKAIEKAKINTEAARQIIHYINRDFFDFKHEYLFDEIITNMPMVTGKKGEKEILSLYQGFFQKAREHLISKGMIILYTHNLELVKELSKKEGYALREQWSISKKEGAYVTVLQV